MFQKISYQLKLYLTFSILIIFILITCGTSFYQYNSRLLRKNLEKNSLESLNLFQSRVEDLLNNMDKILTRLHASHDFTKLVTPADSSTYFSLHPSISSRMKHIFASTLTTESKNGSIRYISNHYESIGMRLVQNEYGDRPISSSELSEISYIKEGLSTNQYCLYLPPHSSPFSNKSEQVFSVVRPIRDTYHIFGILEYAINVSELNSLMSFANNEIIDDIILLDSNNQLLYSTLKKNTSDISSLYKNQDLSKKEGYYYKDKNTLMCYSHSELTGWTILIRRNIHTTADQISKLGRIIFISYLIGFVVLLLSLFILTKSLTRPLRALKNNLSCIEMNQDIHIDTESNNNEIAVLTIAIEEILNKLRAQNERLIEAKKRALKAHFDAMEAQLNPHFLYNTLSVIGTCGMESGSSAVPKMCAELASLLRYSITYNHKTVSIKNELDNISSYLYIMKMRYEHMLEYDWTIDESLNRIPVPKLILQPIIENCFQHGFENIPPVWKIHIKTYQKDGYWYVSFTNNGNPFEENKKELLYKRFEQFKEHVMEGIRESGTEKQSFGLENTIMRLTIYYNGKEHFNIYTKQNTTTVELGGPIDEIGN